MNDIRFELVEPEFRKFPDQDITLPVRGTRGSAGYDFYATKDLVIEPGTIGKFFTDIRVYMGPDEFLWLTPRSSTGDLFLMIPQTAGIIDSDYVNNPQTGGNVLVKLFNYGREPQVITKGDRLVQGVFQPYLTTYDDNVTAERIGGYGSTGK